MRGGRGASSTSTDAHTSHPSHTGRFVKSATGPDAEVVFAHLVWVGTSAIARVVIILIVRIRQHRRMTMENVLVERIRLVRVVFFGILFPKHSDDE